MSALLRKSQVCVASELGRRADDLGAELLKAAVRADAAGLHEHAALVRVAAHAAREAGLRLDGAARAAFCAARRGEALPP